jgi:hypothetical protein
MKVDMSPEAIDARLKMTSELLKLCLSLGQAKPIEEATQKSLTTKKPKEKTNENTQRRSSER